MKSKHRRRGLRTSSMCAAAAALAAAQCLAAEETLIMPEVVVTGTREKESLNETPAAVGVVKKNQIDLVRPNHPSQIMGQIPGVAVAVTNGEGHTTAIRQPFTTNPVYLFLEDGIPIRSTGFFNHNALYETNIPQAGGIEVTRGPGTALYGSDAIGGIVNVLTRTPSGKPELDASAELGTHGFWRVLTGGGNGYANGAWRADLNLTHTDGWRDATGYDRQSGTFRWDHFVNGNAMLKTVLSFSNIDQQTGANSPLVMSDYLNNPKRNYLPIAFRQVQAFRLSTNYEHAFGDSLLSITPYIRDNSMDLLASFTLNFDPTISTVQNRSFGLLAKWRTDFPNFMRARVIVGTDIDISPGERREDSLNVTTSGAAPTRTFSAYSVARRVYDYDVTFSGISPYVHGEISPTERLRISAGLRYDHLSYRFRNRLAGAPIFVAPGAPFPGARFYGQADDADPTFTHLSPKLGATYAIAPNMHAFAGYSHGFRAPSEGNLFRPAVGASAAAAAAAAQSSAALKPIKADQVEVGLRGLIAKVSYDVVLYELRKRDDIVSQRDPVTTFTQTVNAGETRHRGVEIGLGAPLVSAWRLDTAFSYAKHTYEDWVTSAGIFSGKEIESAPRVMATTRLTWQPRTDAQVQFEWVRLGRYWLDAANTQTYPGHDLFNVRTNWRLTRHLALFGSIYNLTDKRYADSAQLSSNQPVLSPGLPRTFYAGLELKW
ncbi:MAG TPA: TonB-dependent receptor [Burkholderiales bacterium]|nr:TonB-dependent receptor [Burkholderiales bacterium]